MTGDYCKRNQAVTPTAVPGPDEVSLLEQVNTALGSWLELLTWQTLFSPARFLGPTESLPSRLRHHLGRREPDLDGAPGVVLVYYPGKSHLRGLAGNPPLTSVGQGPIWAQK